MIEQEVYLPPGYLKKISTFSTHNTVLTPRPTFITPIFLPSGELKIECLNCSYENDFTIYPENDYLQKKWNFLLPHFSVLGYQEDMKQIKKSRSGFFSYSDQGSPQKKMRSIHIELITSFHFMDDFDSAMKVITICLQMSDFSDDLSKMANTALIDLLIRFHFVPTAQFDLLYNKKRIRVAYFTKWQDIRARGEI